MTETEHTEELPTRVRDLRHYVDKNVHKICAQMSGQPGLDQQGQIKRVEKAIRYAARIQVALDALLTKVTERDFDAWMTQKAAEKAEMQAKFDAIVSESDEDEDDEDQNGTEGFVLNLEDDDTV